MKPKTNIPRIRCYLRRVKLDAGGYVRKGQDMPHGAYYGVGRLLYYVCAEWERTDGQPGVWERVDHTFRADSRVDAIERVKRDLRSSFPSPVRLVFSGKD